MDNGQPDVVGKLILLFDDKGNSNVAMEGQVPLGPAIARIEILKARMVADMVAQENRAMQQRPGIVLPNGPLPPQF